MTAIDDVLIQIDALLRRDPVAVGGTAAGARLRDMLTDMAATGNRRQDPMREVLARIGDKWSVLLLLLLDMRSFRHSTLRRLVGLVSADGAISPRIFRIRIRALERDGLVLRQELSTNPPAVVYSLTDNGRGLVKQIESVMQWTRSHCEELRCAQQQFDMRAAREHK
jgi:DNA-binding HxlR family transcriptional regulator